MHLNVRVHNELQEQLSNASNTTMADRVVQTMFFSPPRAQLQMSAPAGANVLSRRLPPLAWGVASALCLPACAEMAAERTIGTDPPSLTQSAEAKQTYHSYATESIETQTN